MSNLSARRYLLSPGCRFRLDDNKFVVETRDEEIIVETQRPEVMEHVFRELRAGAQLSEIASKYGLSSADVLDPVLESLLAADLLLDVNRAIEGKNPLETTEALQAEARFWARPIFEQPFWDDLLGGRCTQSQVLGWGVEFYHFVDAANIYMPLGVSHTRNVRPLRKAVARHYVEEMDHGVIFLDGLAQCGLDRASVLAAPPLPHTRALVNHLVELAYEGEVSYTASFAVMQPRLSPTTYAALDAFYGRLTELYPYAKGMFDAFHRHARLDVDLRHEDTVFSQLCMEGRGLSSDQCVRASNAMRAVAESFILFFEGIRDVYGEAEAFSPRRPLYIEALT